MRLSKIRRLTHHVAINDDVVFFVDEIFGVLGILDWERDWLLNQHHWRYQVTASCLSGVVDDVAAADDLGGRFCLSPNGLVIDSAHDEGLGVIADEREKQSDVG